MMKKAIIFLFIVLLSFGFSSNAYSQCAMCSVTAEQSVKNGNSQGKGLNTGIIYLLVIPYLMITTVGIFWYRGQQRKKKLEETMHL